MQGHEPGLAELGLANRQNPFVEIDIRAGLVPAEIAKPLDVLPGTPSLTVIRRYLGPDRRLFEISVSEHPADRYTYSLQLRRGWQSGSGGGWSAI